MFCIRRSPFGAFADVKASSHFFVLEEVESTDIIECLSLVRSLSFNTFDTRIVDGAMPETKAALSADASSGATGGVL